MVRTILPAPPLDSLCYNVTMKLYRWELSLKKTPRPLSPGMVTQLSLLRDELRAEQTAHFAAQDDVIKTTRTRLETVYRKVYRDEAREDQEAAAEASAPTVPPPRAIKPGDPAY